LWQRLFNTLGFQTVLSGKTSEEVRALGTQIAGAEFCFPAKTALGHVATLAEKEGVDFIFFPYMVSEVQNQHTTAAKFCPYVMGGPSYARAALEINGMDTSRLLAPVVDLRLSDSKMADFLVRAMGTQLGRTRRQFRRAWRAGVRAQRSFERRCREEGQKILEEATSKDQKLLVLAGRPYNNYDTGLNLGLPQKLAEQGRTVLPLDLLGADVGLLGERYRNTFWSYGQKILAALEQVASDDRLDTVYLTNFNCGPDSFLLSYAEEILGNRPFLALELDEHGADAGYMTRIEAFCDVLKRPRSAPSKRPPHRPEPDDFRDRTIWLPPMHPLGPTLMAAGFRYHGYRSKAIPSEDQESFELGRALTRGSECLPTALTIGAFLKAFRREEPNGQHALFMPTAHGPCRFGQYCTLHRQILDREELSGVAILSPSSFNSYQGVDEPVRRSLWRGMLVADVLLKAVCKVRPYEINPGETDRVMAEEEARLIGVIEAGGDIFQAVRGSIDRIASVPVSGPPKPLVGVVGEIYVRCNTFANEDVIGAIERFGGEAWLAPMSEWILYTAATQSLAFWDRSRNFIKKWLADLKNLYLYNQEHKAYAAAGPFLADRLEPDIYDVLEEGRKLVPLNFEGEAILTAGRAVKFAHQGCAMVVNCAPFGCMPGTLTTALFRKLAPELGIPIVSMFYDGHGNQNQRLEVFLNNAVKKPQAPSKPASREHRPKDSAAVRP
jgi:predicted nucleotide-binding protein (sugar kinase/HSP70/actin superfamily)